MSSKYISKDYHIYSFEPVYNQILYKNVYDNNLTDKIKVFPFGLSNNKITLQGGIIDFSVKSNYGFTRIDNLQPADEKSKYLIEVERLDDLNIDNISIIKLDVEGCEKKVLEGAYNTIVKNLPSILIEIWCTSPASVKLNKGNNDRIKNSLDCFEFLFKLGYICIPIVPYSDDFLFIHHKKKELLQNFLVKI
jgi:FkbM family methyltransferase